MENTKDSKLPQSTSLTDKYFKDQSEKTRLIIILSTFGLLVFLAIALTVPFKDNIFRKLFPKFFSNASSAVVVKDVSGQPLTLTEGSYVTASPVVRLDLTSPLGPARVASASSTVMGVSTDLAQASPESIQTNNVCSQCSLNCPSGEPASGTQCSLVNSQTGQVISQTQACNAVCQPLPSPSPDLTPSPSPATCASIGGKCGNESGVTADGFQCMPSSNQSSGFDCAGTYNYCFLTCQPGPTPSPVTPSPTMSPSPRIQTFTSGFKIAEGESTDGKDLLAAAPIQVYTGQPSMVVDYTLANTTLGVHKLWLQFYSVDNTSSDVIPVQIQLVSPTASPSPSPEVGSLMNGLVSYWKMDQGVKDSKGQVHGVANGTSVVEGKFGKALSFNGTSDSVVLSDVSTFPSGSSSRTSCGWVNSASASTGGVFYYGVTTAGSNSAFMLGKQDAHLLGALYNNGVTSTAASSWFNANPGWNYVCALFDNSTSKLQIYGNGVLIGSKAILAPVNTITGTGAQGLIGSMKRPGDLYWKGMIDEVALWSRALTEQEIKGLYNNGAGKEILAAGPSTPSAPELTLTANPASITGAGPTTLTWNIIGDVAADSCEFSREATNINNISLGGDTWGQSARNLADLTPGSHSRTLIQTKNVTVSTPRVFTITCKFGGVTKTATATVTFNPIALPTVTLTANPNVVSRTGGTTSLTYTLLGGAADSCSLTQRGTATVTGDWSGTIRGADVALATRSVTPGAVITTGSHSRTVTFRPTVAGRNRIFEISCVNAAGRTVKSTATVTTF